MRSLPQALIAGTIIASASLPSVAQRPSGDDESANPDAARALASLQIVHSFALTGRLSPAFADWICVVHRLNDNKSENSQDWKVAYLTNCSANTAALSSARNGRSDSDWLSKFFYVAAIGGLDHGGAAASGDAPPNVLPVTDGAGQSANAGAPVNANSTAGPNAASVSSGEVVTQTITNPEPSTILLVGSGLMAFAASVRRRRKSS
jgi:hypothetical protein